MRSASYATTASSRRCHGRISLFHVAMAATALLLLAPCAMASAPAVAVTVQDIAPDVQARIAQVEQSLTTPIAIKGIPIQRMRLQERMAFHHVPAVSIAVINNGRLEWARAYGVLDTRQRLPATAASLFQAGSVSKPISAMAALRLVEQGKLLLDTDANTQLHSWQIPSNEFTRQSPVTLRKLLNHSAGMTVHGFYGYARGEQVPSLLQVLDGAPPANSAPVRVTTTPGSEWKYSGGGYSVVQLMMIEAAKQPFPALLQALVLDPLEMHDSTFALTLPPAWQTRAATAYHGDGEAVAGNWHVYPESAAAALWTTPTDLAKVVVDIQHSQGLSSGKVLSNATTTTMLQPILGDYGLGLFIDKAGDGIRFGHSGGTDGFRTQVYGYTGTGQGVVVMTNSDNGAGLIDEILASVAAVYDWPDLKPIEKAAAAPNAVTNAAVAGEYKMMDTPVHIIAEGNRLYFQNDLFGAARMELFAQSNGAFFMTASDMTIDFHRQGSSKASGFSLLRSGSTYEGTRQE